MDKKEPIKISLKMVIIVIVLILAIIGGVIYYFIHSNYKEELQVVTEQGKNCTTNTYMDYKKLPTCNDIEYNSLECVIWETIENSFNTNLNNVLIKSREELEEYLGGSKFDVFMDSKRVSILEIIEEFDDEYFENNNLAIYFGPSELVSVNIQNETVTINLQKLHSTGYKLPEFLNFIALNKDVEKVNFDIYTVQKESIIDIWEDYNIVIGILLIIIISVITHKSKKKTIKISLISLLFVLILLNIFYFINSATATVDKPIIYLYPTQETEVNVKLEKSESITTSYPKYINGWNVKANVDGNLVDLDTGKNLYALYYENKSNIDFKMTDEGFCVKGEDVTAFLEERLKILGLNDKETEEFIIYWLPKLEKNKYNYIRFATEKEINQNMPVDITPNPDTFIRVLMVYKPLNKKINVKEQSLNSVERKGFTAVEWGGTEIQ